MGTTIKSQGTELYWASAATTNKRVVAPNGISGLGGAKDRIEDSSLDNASDKTYVGGLGDPGQVTIGIILKKGETLHDDLVSLKTAGTEVSWGIYSGDAATAPTTVGSVMQTVVGRVSAIFTGYIADLNVDISGNDIWKGTLVIQRSGSVSYDFTP